MGALVQLALWALTIGSTGTLIFKSATDDTSDLIDRATPNLAVLAALGIAGFVVYKTLKK